MVGRLISVGEDLFSMLVSGRVFLYKFFNCQQKPYFNPEFTLSKIISSSTVSIRTISRVQVTIKDRSGRRACRLPARSSCLKHDTDEALLMKSRSVIETYICIILYIICICNVYVVTYVWSLHVCIYIQWWQTLWRIFLKEVFWHSDIPLIFWFCPAWKE